MIQWHDGIRGEERSARQRLHEAQARHRKARREHRWLAGFFVFTVLTTLYDLGWAAFHAGVLSWVWVVVAAVAACFTAVFLLPRSDRYVAEHHLALVKAQVAHEDVQARLADEAPA